LKGRGCGITFPMERSPNHAPIVGFFKEVFPVEVSYFTSLYRSPQRKAFVLNTKNYNLSKITIVN
jgi:hypothetical protein